MRDPVDAIAGRCRLEGAYKAKPREVQLAPTTRVVVDQAKARAKILAKIEVVVKRPGSGAVENNDIGSLVEDGCLEVPNNNNSEV